MHVSIPPRNKKLDFSGFSMRPDRELNKAIEADAAHIKTPKLEINPIRIVASYVWARSRITNIGSIPFAIDKPIIDEYIAIGAIIDEDKKIRMFFFIFIYYIYHPNSIAAYLKNQNQKKS